MRIERLYHNAPSAAENSLDSSQLLSVGGSSAVPLANALPRALEAAAYSLRKRVVCPRWWLIGVMSQWLAKDSDLLTLELSLKEDDWLLSGPAITPKNFPLVVQLWTELFSQVSRADFTDDDTIELSLNRILRGTSSEIDAQKEFMTGYLSSALRVQRVRSVSPRSNSRRAKLGGLSSQNLVLDSVGLVQIVENVLVKQGVPDVLLITFSRDPRRFFTLAAEDLLPPALKRTVPDKTHTIDHSELIKSSLVTLQPDVLQALSRSVNPKKLCSYLSLELMKQNSSSDQSQAGEDIWRGRALGHSELSKLHREQLARAQSFYDHGILSWENEAPRQRVRNLVSRSSHLADSGIVHCWRMSQHAMEALQFEEALSNVLQKSESANLNHEIESGKRGLLLEHAERKPERADKSALVVPASLNSSLPRSERLVPMLDDGNTSAELVLAKTSSKTVARSVARDSSGKREFLNDDDFLMCVAEFYESLTPVQQQAFERERKKMTPEQFKRYVTPALMRHRERG
jgi:hypothetical protein